MNVLSVTCMALGTLALAPQDTPDQYKGARNKAAHSAFRKAMAQNQSAQAEHARVLRELATLGYDNDQDEEARLQRRVHELEVELERLHAQRDVRVHAIEVPDVPDAPDTFEVHVAPTAPSTPHAPHAAHAPHADNDPLILRRPGRYHVVVEGDSDSPQVYAVPSPLRTDDTGGRARSRVEYIHTGGQEGWHEVRELLHEMRSEMRAMRQEMRAMREELRGYRPGNVR